MIIKDGKELMINMLTGERFLRDLSAEDQAFLILQDDNLTNEEKIEDCLSLGLDYDDIVSLALELD